MSDESRKNFLHLNGGGQWPDFEWSGLELGAEGLLQLDSLPRLEGVLPADLAQARTPDGPAGIAVARDGSIYFSDPKGHRVFRVDGCDTTTAPLPCVGGRGDAPNELDTPRGLLIPKHRPSLFVADSGNHRVQVWDLDTGALVDLWGQTPGADRPQPGSEPGRLDTPWSLAGDDEGNVYVVDYGNRRVQKFDRAGKPVPGFWEAMRQAGILSRPSGVGAHSEGDATRVYVLDRDRRAVFVFGADGRPVPGSYPHQPLSFGSGELREPMGIAVTDDAVYVGDNHHRAVFKFRRAGDHPWIGAAIGYQGPVAALGVDSRGGLLVHSGTSLAPLRLEVQGGHRSRGVLWSRAIQARDYEVKWHRLQALTESKGPRARLRLFVHTSDDPGAPPRVDPDASDPFSDPKWRPKDGAIDPLADVSDLFVGGAPSTYIWVGGLFSGDGRSTPAVAQMRVEFDRETYLDHLPALYRTEPQCGDFLPRFLALFESFFTGVEGRIAALPALFDPSAAPEEHLPWLAGWLGLELEENWSVARKREVIASAFELYGRRGTAEGLRHSLRTITGVEALVEEPILHAAWWSLPAPEKPCDCEKPAALSREPAWEETESSILGVTTMLAAARPEGAVVGTSAVLDQSHLIRGEEFGAPLFADVAHQFRVEVYRGQVTCERTLERIRDLIEREKPAHTTYHLCVIEPRMRVGLQARLGVDTLVGGPPPAVALGGTALEKATLGGKPAGRIGGESRVGLTTRVG